MSTEIEGGGGGGWGGWGGRGDAWRQWNLHWKRASAGEPAAVAALVVRGASNLQYALGYAGSSVPVRKNCSVTCVLSVAAVHIHIQASLSTPFVRRDSGL
jgi:hypothetical protein